MIEQKREEWDKNLNESQPDDANLLDDDDLFNSYQSGSLLDEVRDRRKNNKSKLGGASGGAGPSAKPKKTPGPIRARSPSKRKSTAPSFNPYVSFATHALASPPDSPLKKGKRGVNTGSGKVGSEKSSRPVRKARRTLKRKVESEEEAEEADEPEEEEDEPEEDWKREATPSPPPAPLPPLRRRAEPTRRAPAPYRDPPVPLSPSATTLPLQGPLISPVRRIVSPQSTTSSPSSSSGTRPVRMAPVFNRSQTLMPVKVIKVSPGTSVVRRPVPGIGAGGVGMSPTSQRYSMVRLPPQGSSGSAGPSTSGRQYVMANQMPRVRIAPPTPGSPSRMMFPVRVVQRTPTQAPASAERPNFGIYERPRLSLRARTDSDASRSSLPGSSQSSQPSRPPP